MKPLSFRLLLVATVALSSAARADFTFEGKVWNPVAGVLTAVAQGLRTKDTDESARARLVKVVGTNETFTGIANATVSATVTLQGRTDCGALQLRYQGPTQFYTAELCWTAEGQLKANLAKRDGATRTDLKSVVLRASTQAGAYNVAFTAAGHDFFLYVDGSLVAIATDARFGPGQIAVSAARAGALKNIQVTDRKASCLLTGISESQVGTARFPDLTDTSFHTARGTFLGTGKEQFWLLAESELWPRTAGLACTSRTYVTGGIMSHKGRMLLAIRVSGDVVASRDLGPVTPSSKVIQFFVHAVGPNRSTAYLYVDGGPPLTYTGIGFSRHSIGVSARSNIPLYLQLQWETSPAPGFSFEEQDALAARAAEDE